MREPPARVRFFGHPVVSIPTVGLCGLVIYGWSQNPGAIVIGVAALVGLVWTAKASHARSQYRAWRRAWDNMAEPRASRSQMPRVVSGLIALAVIGGFALSEIGIGADIGPPLAGLAILGGVGVAIAVAIWALTKRLRSRKARRAMRDRRDCVTVVVTRPLMPVPSLDEAYKALPQHCWRAINADRP